MDPSAGSPTFDNTPLGGNPGGTFVDNALAQSESAVVGFADQRHASLVPSVSENKALGTAGSSISGYEEIKRFVQDDPVKSYKIMLNQLRKRA